MFTAFRQPLVEDLRIVCLPYAGGSANNYRQWVGRIPDADVLAARLPGRDSRFNEAPATRFEPLLDHLLEELLPYLDGRFCLFGHSMGGLLAYELGRRLEALGRAPERVIASGTAAPGLLSRPRRCGASDAAGPGAPDDEALLAALRADEAAPEEILANKELMALLLPILRADLDVVADYTYDASAPALRAPLHLYYGEDEVADPAALLREWAPAAEAAPEAHGFPGGHFFVDSAREAVLRRLALDVSSRKEAVL